MFEEFRLVVFMIITNGVFGVVGDEVKSVSVMEGDSVTLYTDITDIQRDDKILWIFESQTLIAKITYGSIYDRYEKRFRGRLNVDNQTGSLTIRNIRITDSGLYELKISTSRRTSYKRFNVTVYDKGKLMVVMEGDSVTLHTDITQVQDDDHIRWMFGHQETLIAEINKYGNSYSLYIDDDDGDDYYDDYVRLSHRLQLDHQTGSLTITDSRITDAGLYKLQIINSRGTSYKIFSVYVFEDKRYSQLHNPLLPLLVGPLLVLLLAQLVGGVVIGVVCCFYKKKINRPRKAQVPPAETQLSLIPDVNGSRSPIEEDKDECHTQEDLVAEDVC